MNAILRKIILTSTALSLSGCASWCDLRDEPDDYQACLHRVHVAQVIGAGALIITGAVLVAKSAKGGGSDDNNAYPGDCQHTWQYAKDGSICGNRAADVRPGGY